MKLIAILASLLAASLALAQPAMPEVLIVQLKPQDLEPDDPDPSVPIAAHLAQALDEQGRVLPVVWSLSDPLFREYVNTGRVVDYAPEPELDQVIAAARRLRTPYVMAVRAVRLGPTLDPELVIYSNRGRILWDAASGEDLQPDVRVTVGGETDWFGSAESVARTWAGRLADGPFSQYEPQTRFRAPELPSGPLFPERTDATSPTASPDGDSIGDAQRLLDAGEEAAAILLLRDEVDIDPFSPEPRAKLAELLLREGHAAEAAETASRAADLVRDAGELRLLAARAFMLESRYEEALEQLNLGLAVGADGPQAWAIEAELAIADGRYEEAVELFGRSIEIEPTFEARVGRAVAAALSGDEGIAERDLALAIAPDERTLIEVYARTIVLVDTSLLVLQTELRDLPPLIRVNPNDDTLIARAAIAQTRTRTLADLIANLPVPARHVESHRSRVLALNLLAQAGIELFQFSRTRDEVLASNALLTLGQALELLPAVRERYAAERTMDPLVTLAD